MAIFRGRGREGGREGRREIEYYDKNNYGVKEESTESERQMEKEKGSEKIKWTYHGDAAVLELLHFQVLHLLLGLALSVGFEKREGAKVR